MSIPRKFLSSYQTKLELLMCNRYRSQGRSLPRRFSSTTTKLSQDWRIQSSLIPVVAGILTALFSKPPSESE